VPFEALMRRGDAKSQEGYGKDGRGLLLFSLIILKI